MSLGNSLAMEKKKYGNPMKMLFMSRRYFVFTSVYERKMVLLCNHSCVSVVKTSTWLNLFSRMFLIKINFFDHSAYFLASV